MSTVPHVFAPSKGLSPKNQALYWKVFRNRLAFHDNRRKVRLFLPLIRKRCGLSGRKGK